MKRSDLVLEEVDAALSELSDLLAGIKDNKEVKQFLSEILTQSELDDLALRWLLMRRLRQGQTQRSIAADLHISLCKITRGSKVLKNPDSICGKYIIDFEMGRLNPRT